VKLSTNTAAVATRKGVQRRSVVVRRLLLLQLRLCLVRKAGVRHGDAAGADAAAAGTGRLAAAARSRCGCRCTLCRVLEKVRYVVASGERRRH
jgi:hypothetical protein